MIRLDYWTRPLDFRERRWSYHLRKATVAPALAVLVGAGAWFTLAAGAALWLASKLPRYRSIPLTRDGVADLLLFTAAGWILEARALAGWPGAVVAVVGLAAAYLGLCDARWYDEREALIPGEPLPNWLERILDDDR